MSNTLYYGTTEAIKAELGFDFDGAVFLLITPEEMVLPYNSLETLKADIQAMRDFGDVFDVSYIA